MMLQSIAETGTAVRTCAAGAHVLWLIACDCARSNKIDSRVWGSGWLLRAVTISALVAELDGRSKY